MNLTNISIIKNLCKELDIRPSKKLGQSFLIPSTRDKDVLDKIIQAGELKKNDTVLEIGPGFGTLTQELLKYVDNLVVVEKDKRLVEFLSKEIKGLKIINDDILETDVWEILQRDPSTPNDPKGRSGQVGTYKIISNLPYQITSPVLWKFLHDIENRPELMVLMIQKEVAERIVAKPGKMSILSVLCQFYAEVELVSVVGRENFWPESEVDSAIVKLKIHPVKSSKAGPPLAEFDRVNFFRIVKIGFSAKRKMLKNNLSTGLKIPAIEIEKSLEKAGLNKKVRAQELSAGQWTSLFDSLIGFISN